MSSCADYTRLDDADLLRLAAGGDSRAFETLYGRYIRAAVELARRILGSGPAAEDVAQEALLQLWRTSRSFAADRGTVRAWVQVVVRSRALDHLRRERVRTQVAERAFASALENAAAAAVEVDRSDARRSVVASLLRLPREQRAVLGLILLAGHTQAQVASALDVPLGTVKGRSRLGLRRLRQELLAT